MDKCVECGKEHPTIKDQGDWYCSDCWLLFNDIETYCFYESKEINENNKVI